MDTNGRPKTLPLKRFLISGGKYPNDGKGGKGIGTIKNPAITAEMPLSSRAKSRGICREKQEQQFPGKGILNGKAGGIDSQG
ncbi:hypothetical protein NZJ93_12935 [Desulfofundulus thermocisternus]|nr:hypothetical protein [Desulfofundulus thermocisternus]